MMPSHHLHVKWVQIVATDSSLIEIDIKFIAVGRALTRDVVASYVVGKNDTPEQYHTAVSFQATPICLKVRAANDSKIINR